MNYTYVNHEQEIIVAYLQENGGASKEDIVIDCGVEPMDIEFALDRQLIAGCDEWFDVA